MTVKRANRPHKDKGAMNPMSFSNVSLHDSTHPTLPAYGLASNFLASVFKEELAWEPFPNTSEHTESKRAFTLVGNGFVPAQSIQNRICKACDNVLREAILQVDHGQKVHKKRYTCSCRVEACYWIGQEPAKA